MMRHCDGNDLYVLKADGYTPCDCGMRFDDKHHMVVYPHIAFDKYLTTLEDVLRTNCPTFDQRRAALFKANEAAAKANVKYRGRWHE